MAVPKKRTPKSRRNARRSHWFKKAMTQGAKALAFSKSWVPTDVDKNES
jgi:ribosomal protein L32